MRNQPTVVSQGRKIISLFLGTIPIAASVFAQNSNGVKYGLTTGRLESILISLLGLASLILGIRSFSSSKNSVSGHKRRSVLIAACAGLFCIVLAAVHIANTVGGFGTGGGKAGSIVAIFLGLTGIILSGLTLTRLRRAR